MLVAVLLEAVSVGEAQPQPEARDGEQVTRSVPHESLFAAVGDEEERERERSLDRNVSFAFRETPLVDVVRALDAQTDVSFVIDPKGLEEARVDENTPITIEADRMPLRRALDLILEPLDLDYFIADGVLVVSDRVGCRLLAPVTRLYPAPDLVTVRSGNELTFHVDELSEAIQQVVQPDSWEEDGGGEGTIEFSPAAMSLVICNDANLHADVAKVLEDLRKARDRATAIAAALALPPLAEIQTTYYAHQAKLEREILEESNRRPTSENSGARSKTDESRAIALAAPRVPQEVPEPALIESASVSKAQSQADPRDGKRDPESASTESMFAAIGNEKDREAERMLQRRVSFAFDKTPLVEVIGVLDALTDVSFVIDRAALAKERVDVNTPVTVEVNRMPLRSALELVLWPLELGYIIRDGALFIVDLDESRDWRPVTRFYPVPDLIAVRTGSELTVRVDQFVESIQQDVYPDSWEADGGEATIDFSPAAMSLVIRHGPESHAAVEKWLKYLRKARDRSTAIAEGAGLPALSELQAAYDAQQARIEREIIKALTPGPASKNSDAESRRAETRAIALEARRANVRKQAAQAARKAPAATESEAGKSAHARTAKEPVALADIDFTPIGGEADRVAFKMLDKVASCDFREIPLKNVIESFDRQCDARFVMDEDYPSLNRAALERLVTFEIEYVTLREALTRILEPLEMAWIAQDGQIVILPLFSAEQSLTTRIYPVPDLIFARSGAEMTQRVDELMAVVVKTIDPEYWEVDGGEGSVDFLPTALSVAIRADQRKHGLIETLLANLRKARARTTRIAEAKGLPSTSELIATIHSLGRLGGSIRTENLDPSPVDAKSEGRVPIDEETGAVAREAKRVARKALRP